MINKCYRVGDIFELQGDIYYGTFVIISLPRPESNLPIYRVFHLNKQKMSPYMFSGKETFLNEGE